MTVIERAIAKAIISARGNSRARMGSSGLLALLLFLLAAPARAQVELEAARAHGLDTALLFSVAAGDLDDDGDLDLVAKGFDRELVTLLGDGKGRLLSPRVFGDTIDIEGAVALGDVDEDGDLDAVVGIGQSLHFVTRVEIWLGDGDGGLAFSASFEAGVTTRGMLIEDLDGDTHLDVVVVGNPTMGGPGLAVLLGDGSGTFSAPVVVSVATGPVALASLDADEDGFTDAAVLHASGLTLFHGDGLGGFSPGTALVTPLAPRSVLAGDVDLDGHADLVVTGGFETQTYLGDGTGLFVAAPALAATGSASALGDIDGDARPDLLLGGFGLSIHPGDGAGSFGPAIRLSGGTNGPALLVADLDADGRADVVGTSFDRSGVVVYVHDPGRPEALFAGSPLPIPVSGVSGIVAADLDVDGDIDLVTASNLGNPLIAGVTVLLGDGTGEFPALVREAAGSRNSALVAADWNLDGIPDLAVSNFNDDDVSILIGVGTGSFLASGELPVGDQPVALLAVDLDGDGARDLVAANFLDHTVTVFRSLGTGAFDVPLTVATGSERPRGLAGGDFDEDGRMDVVVAHSNLFNMGLLLGDGAGGLAAAGTFETLAIPSAVAVADLDGDGHLDAAVACTGSGFLSLGVTVLFGDGAGGFPRRLDLPVSPAPEAIVAGDVDGDGDPDLVVGFLGEVAVLLGDGEGSFFPAAILAAGNDVASLVLVDLDGDGWLDVATGNRGSSDVALLRNRTADPLIARWGVVNATTGSLADVIRVNGLTGDPHRRRVVIDRAEPFSLTVESVPSRPATRFVVWVWNDTPREGSPVAFSKGVGVVGLPTPAQPSLAPQPLRIANGIGFPSTLGATRWPFAVNRAPTTLAFVPGGLGRAGSFYIQGIILDPASVNGTAAVTNGLEVEVE